MTFYEPTSAADLLSHYAAIKKRLNTPRVPVKVAIEPAARDFEGSSYNYSMAGVAPPPADGTLPLPVKSPFPPKRGRLINAICRASADYFGVALKDLHSDRREAKLCRARHIAMFLAKEITSYSLPSIAKYIGDRDHTTVMHGVRKIATCIAMEDLATIAQVDGVRALLLPAPQAPVVGEPLNAGNPDYAK